MRGRGSSAGEIVALPRRGRMVMGQLAMTRHDPKFGYLCGANCPGNSIGFLTDAVTGGVEY
jgi:hypothetical protein